MTERMTINKAYLRGLIWLMALAFVVLMPRVELPKTPTLVADLDESR